MATQGFQKYFTSEEIVRLEDGLPCLEEWGPHILVPFQGFRLRNARILWLNHRWFGERLFDLLDLSIYKRVSEWALGTFAYISPKVQELENVDTSDSRVLVADRYGCSSGRSPHGGSGRVTVVGRFQAKGIGQTPLVGAGAPDGHSHGCMSLAEAVREAIFAEIAAAEFPCGAVPIIAIIDTGLMFSSPDPKDIYDQNVPRAIAVRPAAVRIAHAERAPLFKSSVTGFSNAQATDVLRTKEIIDKWMESAGRQDPGSPEGRTLQALLATVVEQIAFGQVHRLFSGGYFSSNLTISGALLDFGNMHALPDWSRAQVHSVIEGFGQEMTLLRHLVNSIAFYVAKYRRCGNGIQMGSDLYDGLQSKYRSAWKKYCLTVFQAEGMPQSTQEAIFELLWRYYSSQQRRRVKYRFGHTVAETTDASTGWLYQGITDREYPLGPETEILDGVSRILRTNLSSSQRAIAWRTAARLLRPRETLGRHTLLSEIADLTQEFGTAGAPDRIKNYIDRATDKGRRYWPRLPNGYAVLGHATRGGSSALLVSGPQNGVWIEGIVGGGGSLAFFDERLTEEEGMVLRIQKYGAYWSAILGTEENQGELYFSVRHRRVRVPPMTVTYEPPAQKWIW